MVFMLEYSVIVLDHFRNAESTPQCLPATRLKDAFSTFYTSTSTRQQSTIQLSRIELTVQLTRYMMVCILV